jgi:hypothetical protein
MTQPCQYNSMQIENCQLDDNEKQPNPSLLHTSQISGHLDHFGICPKILSTLKSQWRILINNFF